MTTGHYLLHAWGGGPIPWIAGLIGGAGYWAAFRQRARWRWFLGAVAVALLALVSPLASLASGALFSAHMAQHLLLLLIAPAFLLLSLPRDFSPPQWVRSTLHPLTSWIFGVAPMWFWHVPALCDAAALRPSVYAVQVVSMLAMGSVFWWPILAPRPRDRLQPLIGVVYLFAACLGCTALGMILTLTPIEVCSVFRSSVAPAATRSLVHDTWGISFDADRQIGGLLMWVPMCLVYVGAILVELRRWFGGDELDPIRVASEGGR